MSESSQNFVAVENLNVALGKLQICRALTLSIVRGQVWGILGRNGVGKTTLLHTLAGLRPAESGNSRILGIDAHAGDRKAIAKHLGILFQDNLDPFPSTVMETALIGRHPHIPLWLDESDEDRSLVKSKLASLGLAAFSDRLVSTLSGGERQRLAVATLLSQDPKIMFLDEPTNHLDVYHQIEVLNLLRERCRDSGCAALMILHDVNLASRYCDNLLLLTGDGESIAGATSTVLTEENLLRLYNYPLSPVKTGGRTIWIPQ